MGVASVIALSAAGRSCRMVAQTMTMFWSVAESGGDMLANGSGIVAQPGRIPAGVVDDHLLSGYDFFPTLLDYLHLEHHDDRPKPGRSFKAILDGDAGAGRDAVVVFDEYGPVRMLRTRDWKYVHRHPGGPHELFDLADDPGERVNRVDDPALAAHVADLRSRLESWFDDYVDPRRDGIDKGIRGT